MLFVICYFYIDKPTIYFFVAHHSKHYKILKFLANDITYTLSVAIFLVYIYSAIQFCCSSVTLTQEKLLVASNAVLIAGFFKKILKGIWGRYRPETYICHIPSLLKYHVYGFNWL